MENGRHGDRAGGDRGMWWRGPGCRERYMRDPVPDRKAPRVGAPAWLTNRTP